jgi:tetratricopeptide (TPR) repeat protein
MNKEHKAVLNWVELADREKLTPQGKLRALSMAAAAHESLKEYDKACQAYKQCLNLAPTNREFKVSLDRCRKAQTRK